MPRPSVKKHRSDPYKNFNFRVKLRAAKPTPADVRLPEAEMALLDQILEEGRRLELVRDSALGSGGRALFAGAKGTGKTLAAEVIADQLGVDMYRVDLSLIVSEYIGETEKHLARIFDAAEESRAVLFFDEAEALFGTRTDVRNSHDRYANMEIGYFLERLEDYPGVVILATSMKEAIDPAFIRRLRYIVNFPPHRLERSRER